jgi:hypothetical protein
MTVRPATPEGGAALIAAARGRDALDDARITRRGAKAAVLSRTVRWRTSARATSR